MSAGIGIRESNNITNRDLARGLAIAVVFTLLGIAVLAIQVGGADIIDLQVGQVATQAVMAPNQITYTSQIETEAARDRARNAVPTRFTPPDPQVARAQVTQLRKIFDYMETVRADPYASAADKFEWIAAIPDLNLSDTEIDQILIMNEQDWSTVRKESLRLLDSVMREEIKESLVVTKRRELPNKVALDILQAQADVIVAITADMIKANTYPDLERTEADRQAAADAVEPVVVKIEPNELLIPAGTVVGPKEMEKLEALGLQQPALSWVEILAPPTVLMLLTTIIISTYIVQYTPKLIPSSKRLVLLATLLLIFIATAKIVILGGVVTPYLFPIAAMAMMIAILINAQLAFIATVILGFLIGSFITEQPEQIVIYMILSGWTGTLALGRRNRVNNLLWAGLYVGLVNTTLITVFSLLTDLVSTPYAMGQLMLGGLLNGVFSAGLALIGLFVIGNVFGITTSIQLLDLGRPTQPLLRQLLLKAPGTYHHSLMVSNLAEQAAERIGADSLLVRVMAYYHDIGKMQRPYFFIENQPEGMENVHEKLDPQISAKIIISHVTDGLDLAAKYRLPRSIRDGIAQHQGTGLVKFFYYQASEKAKENGGTVDESKFRYPGPKPQSKETGILMLADISETTVRALKPRSAAEIDEIVSKSISHHLETGQLDECDLTISDLYKIRSAFVDILQGIHHPRIKYPEQIKAEEEKARQQAAQAAESAAAPPAEKAAPAPSPVPPAGLVQQE
ncbi:MAG: HDIG domain-containing protein [Anaerolineae bacterium]